jgi:hypothetical protein
MIQNEIMHLRYTVLRLQPRTFLTKPSGYLCDQNLFSSSFIEIVNSYSRAAGRALCSSARPAARGACPRPRQDHQEACDAGGSYHWLRPYVSAQEVAAETEHQGSGAQREPDRNMHAVW